MSGYSTTAQIEGEGATNAGAGVPLLPEWTVFQTAFVVPDIDAAIQAYAVNLNIGSWIIFDHIQYQNIIYLGEPCRAKASIALGCSGGMTYELIQPLDDHPSIFNADRSRAFHHVALLVPSMDEALSVYADRGAELITDVRAAGGVRATFVDTRKHIDCYTELVEASNAVREFITLPYQLAKPLNGAIPTISRV